MSGYSNPTEKDQYSGVKPNRRALPDIWPFNSSKRQENDASLQIIPEGKPLPPAKRLVVILPDVDIEDITLPNRIWNLASTGHSQVLLMIRPSGDETEYHSRIILANLASLIRDPWVVVQTQLIQGQSIEQAARQYAQSDDVFICYAEHQTGGFLQKHRLAVALGHATHMPVYTLKGPVSEMKEPVSGILVDVFLIALCLISLVVFFAIEVWVGQNSNGTVQTMMQILAMIAEVWILAAIVNHSTRK